MRNRADGNSVKRSLTSNATLSELQSNARFALASLLVLLPTTQAQIPHHVVSGSNFVILDADEAQRFPLLGILPFCQSKAAQWVLTLVLLLLVIPLAACIIVARQGSHHHPALRLPHISETFARLAFYFQLELSAFASVLSEEIFSIVRMPVSVGLNLATRLSGGALKSRHDGASALLNGSYGGLPGDAPSSRKKRRAKNGQQSSNTANAHASSSSGSQYPGLWNTGNSCFLNSTLQCLASVRGVQTLLEGIMEEAERWDVPTPVTDALFDLVVQLNTPSSRRSAIIPRQVTDALSNLPQTRAGSFFYAHQQQDAHELLALVTDALDKEVKEIEGERQAFQQTQSVGLRALFAPAASPFPSSAMINPFRGLIAQRTACLDCGYVEAVRHYPTDELSLSIPMRAGSAITIEQCLANWSKLEVVDWICFHCSIRRTLKMLRAEADEYQSTIAKVAPTSTSSSMANGTSKSRQALSPSAKKKSGAKRRRLRETKEKEDILNEILTQGYTEDEEETKSLLQHYDIHLERTFSRAATKQVMLARTPSILVLHLNRSSYSAGNFGASKNNASVLFDDDLDVSDILTGGDLTIRGDRPISRGATPYGLDDDGTNEKATWSNVPAHTNGKGSRNGHPSSRTNDGYLDDHLHSITKDIEPPKSRYRLCGIVVHYGGHSSGHYVAFRRRRRGAEDEDGRNDYGLQASMSDIDAGWANTPQQGQALHSDEWYRISDDSVSRCSWRDVMMQNPFLLFYERMGDEVDESKAHKTNGSGSKVAAAANGHLPSKNGYLNGHSHSHESIRNGQSDPSFVPNGFEAFAEYAQKSHLSPRVIQRWQAMPIGGDRTVSKSSADLAKKSANVAVLNGTEGEKVVEPLE